MTLKEIKSLITMAGEENVLFVAQAYADSGELDRLSPAEALELVTALYKNLEQYQQIRTINGVRPLTETAPKYLGTAFHVVYGMKAGLYTPHGGFRELIRVAQYVKDGVNK